MHAPRDPRPSDERRHVAFVGASWHDDIVGRCRDAFLAEAVKLGIAEDRIDVFTVPGAFELPLFVQRAARSGRYDAVVAAALVVDGGIYRHEFVAEAVVSGLMRVQTETDVPVLSAVLTPHHFHGPEHVEFFREHFFVKGAEVARACVGALDALEDLAAPTTAG